MTRQLANNKAIHSCKQTIRHCIVIELLPTVKLRGVDNAMGNTVDVVDIEQKAAPGALCDAADEIGLAHGRSAAHLASIGANWI